MFKTKKCPICFTIIKKSFRYPHYVCSDCSQRASDKNGRLLNFYNVDLSGGFWGRYLDTKEIYESHICYIDGVKCYADEAHFGGIVVEIDKTTFRKQLIQKIGEFFERVDEYFQKNEKNKYERFKVKRDKSKVKS